MRPARSSRRSRPIRPPATPASSTATSSTQLNGQKVLNGSALQMAVSRASPPARRSQLGILRNGQPRPSTSTSASTTSRRRGSGQRRRRRRLRSKAGKLGLAVARPHLRTRASSSTSLTTSRRGHRTTSVPAAPQKTPASQPGDVIVEVNRKPVTSAEPVRQRRSTPPPPDKDMLLLVWSKGGASYRVLHPDQG